MLLYYLVRALLRVVFRAVYRMRVEGAHNVPATGGVILASNHVSMLDPLAVGCAIDRRVHFMAKSELFRIPVLSGLLAALGAYPVKRGEADKRAYKRSLDLLKQGRVLGLFPEGTRSLDGKLQAAFSGTAMLAVRTDCPIIPVGVVGTYDIMRKGRGLPGPGRIKVRIGQPIRPLELTRGRRDRQAVELLSRRMMAQIAALVDGGGTDSGDPEVATCDAPDVARGREPNHAEEPEETPMEALQ